MSTDDDKIKSALANEKWDYRTAEGIAEETGIPLAQVISYLETDKDIVWKSSLPDKKGRELYTLNNRRSQSKEFWRNLSTFMGKTSS